uniref:Uncharacterized protein n=1 Tax=Leptocylindrus danicus TaxID=163516 RepID=A0A7S2K907_9STRA
MDKKCDVWPGCSKNSSNTNTNTVTPPEGFQIAAHIVSDDIDSSAYFADIDLPLIRYSDCGPEGAMTDLLPISNIQFRHFPAGVYTHWAPTSISSNGESSNSKSRSRSQLIVCLSPLEVMVSGDERNKQVFEAGQVILLDDTRGKGHKLRSVSHAGDELRPLSALTVNLPLHHHHTALFGKRKTRYPCLDQRFDANNGDAEDDIAWLAHFRNKKRWAVASAGVALSSAFAGWIYLVYPPILIRISEIASVLGLTYGLVHLGESYWDNLRDYDAQVQRFDSDKSEVKVQA